MELPWRAFPLRLARRHPDGDLAARPLICDQADGWLGWTRKRSSLDRSRYYFIALFAARVSFAGDRPVVGVDARGLFGVLAREHFSCETVLRRVGEYAGRIYAGLSGDCFWSEACNRPHGRWCCVD